MISMPENSIFRVSKFTIWKKVKGRGEWNKFSIWTWNKVINRDYIFIGCIMLTCLRIPHQRPVSWPECECPLQFTLRDSLIDWPADIPQGICHILCLLFKHCDYQVYWLLNREKSIHNNIYKRGINYNKSVSFTVNGGEFSAVPTQHLKEFWYLLIYSTNHSL